MSVELWMFLKVMTAPCGRLEGSQNPCRHSGSGQVIDRRVSVHGIVVSLFRRDQLIRRNHCLCHGVVPSLSFNCRLREHWRSY
jgi:hypothetical protein